MRHDECSLIRDRVHLPAPGNTSHFVISFVAPDNGEKCVVELSNRAPTNIKGQQARKPDLAITTTRPDLETVMMGRTTFDGQIKNGKAKRVGDRKLCDEFKGMLRQLDMGFEVIPGTGGTHPDPEMTSSSRSRRRCPTTADDYKAKPRQYSLLTRPVHAVTRRRACGDLPTTSCWILDSRRRQP